MCDVHRCRLSFLQIPICVLTCCVHDVVGTLGDNVGNSTPMTSDLPNTSLQLPNDFPFTVIHKTYEAHEISTARG